MKRTAAVTAITAAVLAMAVAPANALVVKPSTAPLVDANGVQSGCQATVSGAPAPTPTEGEFAGAPGYVDITSSLACSHHWRATSVAPRWQVVTDDGKRGTTFPEGVGKTWAPDDSVPSPDPMTLGSQETINPCLMRNDGNIYLPGRSNRPWLLKQGQHQVILGFTAKVNEFKSDLHPYSANVEQLHTVRCTSARAAYR